MNKEDTINKLIEEALTSVDNIKRAAAKPFLLTRIHARLGKKTTSIWEKTGWFIGRPAVAFIGLCLILLINVLVVVFNKPSTAAVSTEQVAQNQADEFSYTVATIYDFENPQP